MLFGQVTDILIRELKALDASPARADLLATYGGRIIDEEVARAVTAPLVKAVIAAGVPSYIETNRFEEWAPDAAASIVRDRHMNRANGAKTLTPATLDALWVSFVNRAAMPMDLALYTCDLGEGR